MTAYSANVNATLFLYSVISFAKSWTATFPFYGRAAAQPVHAGVWQHSLCVSSRAEGEQLWDGDGQRGQGVAARAGGHLGKPRSPGQDGSCHCCSGAGAVRGVFVGAQPQGRTGGKQVVPLLVSLLLGRDTAGQGSSKEIFPPLFL